MKNERAVLAIIDAVIQLEATEREHYTIEGFRTDNTSLFKCRTCKREGWGLLALGNPVRHTSKCKHGEGAATGEEEYDSWNGIGQYPGAF